MKHRTITFLGLLAFALVMGVFWGTWFTLTRSLETFQGPAFLQIGKTIIANVAWPMRILMPLALLLAVLSVVTHPELRSRSFWLMVIGLALMLITLGITVGVEVPIDNAIKGWTAATLPADWTDQRLIWKQYHALRTFTAIGAFAAYLGGAFSPTARSASSV